MRKRVIEAKSISLDDAQILYALRSPYASGESDRAFDLLVAISDSWEGLLIGYDPGVKLLGAENRKAVTCYLDSILFAMFSRLDSFEAMLYHEFTDQAKSRLAMLLRLWVNLLRSGKLITTDITQLLQEALAECGWKEAADLHQQDASEAFTFITEKLELPLLTLKMDIYHTGREDATDDHKFVNERLLEVAIPADVADHEQSVPLEDCLEAYFNNRIEVKRYLERQSTMNSMRTASNPESGCEKAGAMHVETVELDSSALSQSPTSAMAPSSLESPMRRRATSIIQQRFVSDDHGHSSPPKYEADVKRPPGRFRSGSIRKEVMMPAWQFFSLIRTFAKYPKCLLVQAGSQLTIAWYTNNTPKNDAQVAAHFSAKRPILGMCLKRYSFTESGEATRLGTRIDIPTEIGLPHFISDDSMGEDGPIYGNFKLSLQSVVCHRGNSVESGHYISLVKGTNSSEDAEIGGSSEEIQKPHHWMRFDDLASQRITLVDINQALKDEMPYLLFYQIVPIDDLSRGSTDDVLPSYTPSEVQDSGISGISVNSFKLRGSSDEMPPPSRPSLEVTAAEGSPRGRSPIRGQMGQDAVAVSEIPSQAELALPDPETLQYPSRRESIYGKGAFHSRSQSQNGDKFSISLSRLAKRKSKEAVPLAGNGAEAGITGADGPEAPIAEDEKGKYLSQKECKREKSKGRLSRMSNMGSGKGRGEKPERECSVM